MFATLLGPYPVEADAIVEGFGAGLELLADGRPAGDPRAGPAELVDRWRQADVRARGLDGDPRPVKACLVGPYSSIPSGGSVRARRAAIILAAEATVETILALNAAGAIFVQVEEDAFVRLAADDVAERALAAEGLRRLTANLPSGVHVCLSIAGGSAHRAGADLLFDAPFHSYALDLCAGPDNWYLAAAAPGDRGLIVGVADARTPERDEEPIMVWGARYAASLGGRGLDRVGLCPSAGLEGLTPAQARRKLSGLAAAARVAAIADPDELKRSLDPRAVDARSAALGRYAPGPRGSVPLPRPRDDPA